MRLLIVGLLAMVLMCGVAQATQQYNYMENRWETVPDNFEMQYNYMENEWGYHAPDAEMEYNCMENQWDWDDGYNRY